MKVLRCVSGLAAAGLLLGLCVGAMSGTASAQSVDRLVDAGGSPGSFPTITLAMLASSPGDRILVMPGSYPGFQFNRGVHVVGIGSDPSQVVINRCAFHVSTPNVGYDALLSNLTLRTTDPLFVFALAGNELGPGVLTLDGVVIEGGVFLRGGMQGFYTLMHNCRIVPPAGFGFSGESCFVGGPGNYVDIENTYIQGWNADAASFVPAGIGLRVNGGTNIRLHRTKVSGGNGQNAGAPYSAGAHAIASAAPGTVNMRIDGLCEIRGGNGAANAAGGNGVNIAGSIEMGTAFVLGGNGTPPGVGFGIAQPQNLVVDAALSITPNLQYAEGETSVQSGEWVHLNLGTQTLPSFIGIAFETKVPETGIFVPLQLQDVVLIPGSSFSAQVPSAPGLSLPGVIVFAQGVLADPLSGGVVFSNTVAIRLDLM